MEIILKLSIIVFALVFSHAVDLKMKNELFEAANLTDKCGGWGKEIKSYEAYNDVKRHCYLTFRKNVLCCIEKPECPGDLVPETPIVPNLLYPIENLELGCVEKNNRNVDLCNVTSAETEYLMKDDVKKKTSFRVCV